MVMGPEPKVQVSFSNQKLSVVRRRRCLVFVGVVVNFSHFHLLLQNHWANFNQTRLKSSLAEQMKGSALFQGEIIAKL